MIDIHAHILPGLIDGVEDMYDTLEMARMAADSGVDRIIATSHCNIRECMGIISGENILTDMKVWSERSEREDPDKDPARNGSIFDRRPSGADRES